MSRARPKMTPDQRRSTDRALRSVFAGLAFSISGLFADAIHRKLGSGIGKAHHTRVRGRKQPAGSKLARSFAKARGLAKEDAGGLYFHGGELTKASRERSEKRFIRLVMAARKKLDGNIVPLNWA